MIKAVGAVDVSLVGQPAGSFDPDFHQAKEEFQQRFTVRELLS